MANDKSNMLELLLNFVTKGDKEARAAIDSVNKSAKSASTQAGQISSQPGPFKGWQQEAANVLATHKQLGGELDNIIEMYAGGMGYETRQIAEAVALYSELGNAIEQVGAKAAKAGQQQDRASTKFAKNMLLGIGGYTVSMTGSNLTQYIGQLTLPVEAYTKAAGLAEEQSRKWLSVQDEQEKATQRIGRALSESTLPYQKQVVGLAEKWASLLEKYPALAGAVGATAAVGNVVGNTLIVGGQILSAVASFKTLSMLMDNMKAASAASAAASASSSAAALSTAEAAAESAVAATASAQAAVSGTAVGGATGLSNAELHAMFGVTSVSVAGVVAAVLSGVVTGQIVNEILARTSLGGKIGEATNGTMQFMTAGQISTAGVHEIWKLFGATDSAANTAAISVGRFLGAIEKTNEEASKAPSSFVTQEAVDTFIAYQKQNATAEKEYSKQRSEIVKDAGKQRVDLERKVEQDRLDVVADFADRKAEAEKNYEDKRADLISSYNESDSSERESLSRKHIERLRNQAAEEEAYEQEYYADRLKTVRDANKDAVRAEEDHQREMLELRESHALTENELLDEQDAFGLLKENQRYELERQQKERAYQIEVQRRDEDLAQRLADMEQEFAIERAKRLARIQQEIVDEETEYQAKQQREQTKLVEKLKKLDVDHAQEMAQLDLQLADKLKKLDAQKKLEMKQLEEDTKDKLNTLELTYNEERQQRQAAFNDQLRDLDAALLGETKLKQQWYATQSDLLKQYVDAWAQVGASSNLPGYEVKGSRASGGRVSEGLWYLHDNEVVLNSGEVAMLNALLSQRRSAREGATVSLSQNFSFKGSFTEGDKKWFREAAKESAYDAFLEVING